MSAMRGILEQLCPRCRTGKIFRKSVWLFPRMYERCPACGLKFEREDGYFLGAMYIGYGLGVGAIAVLAALVWEVFEVAIAEERRRRDRPVSAAGAGADVDGPRAVDLYGPGD